MQHTLTTQTPATRDSGKVRLGAAMRGPAKDTVAIVPTAVADSGKIRLGAAMRVPGRRHA